MFDRSVSAGGSWEGLGGWEKEPRAADVLCALLFLLKADPRTRDWPPAAFSLAGSLCPSASGHAHRPSPGSRSWSKVSGTLFSRSAVDGSAEAAAPRRKRKRRGRGRGRGEESRRHEALSHLSGFVSDCDYRLDVFIRAV